MFDTGSSDTWTVQTGFDCRDGFGQAQPPVRCGFGAPKAAKFARAVVDGVHFHLEYGSGEQISGPLGYSDISCGGLTVLQQKVGLANVTFWHGNGVTVGVLGLAFPSLTSAYYGRIGDESTENAYPYSPFFTSVRTQGLVEPMFSVTMARNSSEGVLAWGGLPEGGWSRSHNATTDLIIVRTRPDESFKLQWLKRDANSGNPGKPDWDWRIGPEAVFLYHHRRRTQVAADNGNKQISIHCGHGNNHDVLPSR
jgi:hypothetical protein